MKKTISAIGIIIGLLLVLGSVGSLEFDTINVGQFLLRAIIGVVLVWGGLATLEI